MRALSLPVLFTALVFSACAASAPSQAADRSPAPLPAVGPGQAAAVFAGGCFWCMESDFDKMPGVVATTSGYAGGKLKNPTYEDVTSETSGHLEAVRVVWDTKVTTYGAVLDWYWHHVDPTDRGGQFCDRGDSYRPAVFYSDDQQKTLVEASKAAIERSGVLSKPVVADILPLADNFWPAEVYHQDFHLLNSAHYQRYRTGCGRDARVKKVWGAALPQSPPAP
jgi:peptide-methionine (S)-S-oxide reductase